MRTMEDDAREYVAMRCEPARTVALFNALLVDEIDVLCPIIQRKVQLPRTKKRVLKDVALLPGLLFVHRSITINRHAYRGYGDPLVDGSNVPIFVAHSEIIAMEKSDATDQNVCPKPHEVGSSVSVKVGPFTNAKGKVTKVHNQHCLVDMEGSSLPPVEFHSSLLEKIGS